MRTPRASDPGRQTARHPFLLVATVVLVATLGAVFVGYQSANNVGSNIGRNQTSVVKMGLRTVRRPRVGNVSIMQGGIPRIIHQSWKTSTVPQPYAQWQPSWQSLHPPPGWQYRLWTDEDNQKLVEDHFPWFLPTWDKLPVKIMQVDAVRYMYLYMHGGLYVDLDMVAQRNVEDLLVDRQVVLGMLSDDVDFGHNIPNAFMASVPGHPFWMYCLNLITATLNSGRVGAEVVTGPVLLRDAVAHYNNYSRVHDITVLPPRTVYNDWRRKPPSCRYQRSSFNFTECQMHYTDLYVLPIWTHNWEQQGAANWGSSKLGEQPAKAEDKAPVAPWTWLNFGRKDS